MHGVSPRQTSSQPDARFRADGPDGPAPVVVRPEALRLAADDSGGGALAADLVLTDRLADAIYLGAYVKYVVALANGQRVTVHAADSPLRKQLAIDAPVKIGWSLADQRVIGD